MVRPTILCLLLAACSSTTADPSTDAGSVHDASSSKPEAGRHDAVVDHAVDRGVGQGEGAADAAPVNVPITISNVGTSHSMRFSIPVTIGSTTLDVQLDTGSSGLRIVSGAVPNEAFAQVTTTAVTYSYHSGLSIQGVVANASVTIGSLRTPAPIPVMLIQQASCAATAPNCGAPPGQPIGDLTLFGPFKAILGIGMRTTATSEQVGNPIAQLEGEPSFIIKSPAYGGTAGVLELAPGPTEVSAYKTFSLPLKTNGVPLPNGVQSYDDRYGLPACVDDTTSGVDYCLPAELDTGNPPTYIEWPAHGDAGSALLQPGDQVQVQIGPASAPLEQYSFTVGPAPMPGVDEVEIESATGEGFMNLGTVVFFHYDIYFNQAKGLVGFADH